MKDFYFLLGLGCGVIALALLLTIFNCNPRQIEEKMQNQAISHGAAHYEVDTNAVVTFKWNN
jgi:hypothetical protein